MRILSVPSEQGNLDQNKGCGKAPPLILEGREFDETPIVPSNIEDTDKAIYAKAKEVLAKEKALFVGGDHSISYALVKGFSETTDGKKALVVFDAHPDCVQFFAPLSHEDWIQGVVEEKLVKGENILQIGIRKVDPLETEYIKHNKIKVVSAVEVKSKPVQVMDKLLELIALNDEIYVSIDIDGFDPSIAPGTGYLVPNGLLEEEFMPLLDALLKSGKARGIDLVEVNPLKDVEGRTVELAKRIVEKVIEND
ncbi:MAG: hypothetical protein CL943_03035 [Candidatus Diapherotrites archaeon]|uniref:Arginase family protein n=1 Tax=Candidatus Iainarchaeum sp. TaxID=3101447 RepID=A0A2D6M1F6_9ARCH|nr:hypothetical protein [Candidatus Diapherotrites archaeon]|tara:strand:- start:3330 stop:4085 length:756 start_codon:yes stop_codon:yes gene_type:complete